MKVDGWNNFCRVFELPEQFPKGFCFGGGLDVTFKMVDWFNPVPDIGNPAISKDEWLHKFETLEGMEKEISFEETEKNIITFLKQKVYIKQGRKYLVIYSFGKATFFEG